MRSKVCAKHQKIGRAGLVQPHDLIIVAFLLEETVLACASACVRTGTRAHARAHVCVCVCTYVCLHVCVGR